eukprot:3087852-Amphidinium_carterae.1
MLKHTAESNCAMSFPSIQYQNHVPREHDASVCVKSVWRLAWCASRLLRCEGNNLGVKAAEAATSCN